MLSIADGKVWQKNKSLPYKHAIAAYGTAMAYIPSQIAYGTIYITIVIMNNE